jgi:hypothetical protein
MSQKLIAEFRKNSAESGLPLAEIKKRLKSNKINNLQEEMAQKEVKNVA